MKRWAALLIAVAACNTPDRIIAPTQPNVAINEVQQGYIVRFRSDVDSVQQLAETIVNTHNGKLRFVYTHAVKGFAADLPEQAVDGLSRNPNIDLIELDKEVKLIEPKGIVLNALESSWGLDRIDQRNVDLDGQYNPPNIGTGVTIYIIDTGIWTQHIDFAGRASWGVDFTETNNLSPNVDCNGHGTHVAGTAGGNYYGVARGVSLVAVRVFDCFGTTTISMVIAAVDWVTANAIKPAVANMSLGGPYTQTLNDAVTASISSGVVYTISAGNENTDACNSSPASTPNALTVGAIALDDRRSAFSNQGPCVDLFAPGEDIWSDWIGGDMWYVYLCGNSCVMNLNGTSMAAPHAAGVAAQVLSRNPTATALQVHDAIVAQATQGTLWYNLWPTTASRVLYATQDLSGASPPPPPPPAYNSSFSVSCSAMTCVFTGVESGSWNFGDGTISSGLTVSHAYAKGNYTASHTVGSSTSTRQINCNPKRCKPV